MRGWRTPPPKKPSKSKADFARERREKVASLIKQGLLKSERIKQDLLKVPREEFIPELYQDYAYLEVPLPLPRLTATIFCPHSDPLFYEPLGLDEGHKFLEAGLGSGYGAAIAREVVGKDGHVVSMEIDPVAFKYAKANLERSGYRDVVLVLARANLADQQALGVPDTLHFGNHRLCALLRQHAVDLADMADRILSGGCFKAHGAAWRDQPVHPVTSANLSSISRAGRGTSRRLICCLRLGSWRS